MSSPLLNHLRFPSGLTVNTARQRARKHHKTSNIPLNACLDLEVRKNGLHLPWSKALKHMLATTLQCTSAPPQRMTEKDVDEISCRHPSLTQNGFGIVHLPWHEGPHEESLARQREMNHWLVPKCNLALAFISLFTPHEKINRDRNMASIELKHHAEHALKLARPSRDNYIPQGAFIMAALHRGFVLADGPGGFYRGAFFNIKPAPKILDKSELAQNEITNQLKHQLACLGIDETGE